VTPFSSRRLAPAANPNNTSRFGSFFAGRRVTRGRGLRGTGVRGVLRAGTRGGISLTRGVASGSRGSRESRGARGNQVRGRGRVRLATAARGQLWRPARGRKPVANQGQPSAEPTQDELDAELDQIRGKDPETERLNAEMDAYRAAGHPRSIDADELTKAGQPRPRNFTAKS